MLKGADECLFISRLFIRANHFTVQCLPLVGEGYVYGLISSFLNLPIYDDNENHFGLDRSGMPVMGELSRVLFNIVLKETFDREFPKRFPGIAFYRFINEVFITIKVDDDDVLFDEKAVYELMEVLSLVGQIESIIGSDDFLTLYETPYIIYMDSDSIVNVCTTKTFL